LTGTLDRGMRLACQTLIQQDLFLEIPEDPLKAAVRRQLELQKGDQQSLW
jgi:2Fe-2S ferredoxin